MSQLFLVIEMQEAGMFLEVAVMSTDPSRVVYLDLVTPQGPGPVLYIFVDWSTETPPENVFAVPTTCPRGQTTAHTTAVHKVFLSHFITEAMSLIH